MSVSVHVAGLKELEAAMAELGFSNATGRNVMKRALVRAAQPIVEQARALAPVKSGRLRASIGVSTSFANEAGKAAYHSALKGGSSKADAVTALRDAQRSASGGSTVSVAIGPGRLRYASLAEFGAPPHDIAVRRGNGFGRLAFEDAGQFLAPKVVHHPGSPAHRYMTRAWEGGKDAAIASVAGQLSLEIDKAAQRAARKAARAAAKG